MTTHRVAVPRKVPPGPWYLLASVGHARDTARANDCRSVKLDVESGATTAGPRRAAGRR